ncbi:cupin domain-containing protein [Hymenobacter sp. H14-R3]|uniref:cupin domain-containing protein n=1 Tax=Hymenobacter sp. H14-R3 TaxID=3046308 RepID=UPI0024BA947B|nr:cupin domain-containing protein [Hymenobacter sp. H14-R3]MDJ0367718.1 cupin domain-containing protein [Hymenobacter sp. H14-R3]
MENKRNAATPQRPLGARPLLAELVLLDLPTAAGQLYQEPAWTSSDRNALTLFKSDTLRLVLTALHAGATMKTHTAKGDISVQVLAGRLAFATASQLLELGIGQLLTLQANVPHSVTALEDTTFLLTLAISG